MLKIFAATDFTGHYPVGSAAIVVANDVNQAVDILNAQLRACGLPGDQKAEDLVVIDPNMPHAIILCDGEY